MIAAPFHLVFGAFLSVVSASQETAAVAPDHVGFSAFQDVFVQLCYAPFPDQGAFETALASHGTDFVLRARPDGRASSIGSHWSNGPLSLSYVEEAGMPIDLPAPQCRLSGEIASEQDHLAMVELLTAHLTLDKAKSSGKGGINRTSWEVVTPSGEKLRLFFDSRPVREEGFFLASLTLLRLRR